MNRILSEYNKKGFVIIEQIFNKTFIQNTIKDIKNSQNIDIYKDSKGNLRRMERLYNKGEYLKKINLLLKQKLKNIFGFDFNIFKDKYDPKPPGAEGFFTHYDGVFYFKDLNNNKKKGWYEYADFFVTVAIALDLCNEENATIEMAHFHNLPFEKLILNTQNNGTPALLESVEKKLCFQRIDLNIGDIAIFSNTTPHRSKKNNSLVERKILFYTYTPSKFGNTYEKYFYDKKNSKNKTSKSFSGEI